MGKTEELKKMIAGTLKVSESDINEDFLLKTGRFKTSAGSVILGNIVRKIYGIRIDGRNISTFGELLSEIEKDPSFDKADRGSEPGFDEPVSINKKLEERADKKLKYNEREKITVEAAEAKKEAKKEAEDSNENFGNSGAPVYGNISGNIVCGIDIQEIDIFPEADDYWTESFYTDNFTREEIAYCVTAASPRHSFAARWCVKEALQKCGDEYYNTSFSDIQVVMRSGRPELCLRSGGVWRKLPLSCSMSHADNYAVGIVTGVVI